MKVRKVGALLEESKSKTFGSESVLENKRVLVRVGKEKHRGNPVVCMFERKR